MQKQINQNHHLIINILFVLMNIAQVVSIYFWCHEKDGEARPEKIKVPSEASGNYSDSGWSFVNDLVPGPRVGVEAHPFS